MAGSSYKSLGGGGGSIPALTASKAVVTDSAGALAAATTTATEIGYVAGVSSAIQTQIDAKQAKPTWATFSPTVTLVGGSGNVVPVYSTNIGRYMTINKLVHVQVYLTGDGGAEGAGSGQINIALPVASGANHPTSYIHAGYTLNGGVGEKQLMGQIDPSTSTIQLVYWGAVDAVAGLKGSDQSSTSRIIRLQFCYEID